VTESVSVEGDVDTIIVPEEYVSARMVDGMPMRFGTWMLLARFHGLRVAGPRHIEDKTSPSVKFFSSKAQRNF
jgi:hypothetical protein